MTTVPLTSLMLNWSAASQPKSRMSVAGLKLMSVLVPQFQTIFVVGTGRLRHSQVAPLKYPFSLVDLGVPVNGTVTRIFSGILRRMEVSSGSVAVRTLSMLDLNGCN